MTKPMRLIERHSDAFEEAKAYEKTADDQGSPFTWRRGEALNDLTQPERMQAIKADHLKRVERMSVKLQRKPLRPDAEALDIDKVYGKAKVCLACHK